MRWYGLLKAYVCHFLSKFSFQPNYSPSQTMKKTIVLEIFKFLYFHLPPLFFPVSHGVRGCLKINLKVYDVINCLNRYLITHFVWYLGKEKSYDIETLSIDWVLNKEHIYEKIKQKIIKNAKKSQLYISSEPSPFQSTKVIKNKRALKLVISRSSGCETSSENSSFNSYLTKFDDVI